MRVLVFDLKGSIGHFRRPDTTVTHATYPFITRTVLSGLAASVLGLQSLTGDNWFGIQLMSPVTTVAQEMSMLGKGWISGGKDKFNRPTSIELVVSPYYRVFYSGDHIDKLAYMISNGLATYHTYLGSAFCLTFPEFVEVTDLEEVKAPYPDTLEATTTIPTHCAERLLPLKGSVYGRLGGMQYERIRDREFRGTINVVYEVNGKPIRFQPMVKPSGAAYRFVRSNAGQVACLW